MKTHTFSCTVTLSDTEFDMLKKVSQHGYIFNYDGPEGQLELCDNLRDKGLLSEDGDGRVSVTHRGVAFLLANL